MRSAGRPCHRLRRAPFREAEPGGSPGALGDEGLVAIDRDDAGLGDTCQIDGLRPGAAHRRSRRVDLSRRLDGRRRRRHGCGIVPTVSGLGRVRRWSGALLVWAALGLGCAPPRAVQAIHEGRIALHVPRDAVLQAAGKPDLVLASRGVGTFFYRHDDQAVSVSLFDSKVIAFSDGSLWPEAAARATDDADEPVANGRIHVGMTESEVRAVLDDPDGITAKGGVETLHWLTGDEIDSVVTLSGGRVVGFWDRPVSGLTQNLPTADRDVSATSGKVRVGMTMAEVERLLGKPDGMRGGNDAVTHRYESGG